MIIRSLSICLLLLLTHSLEGAEPQALFNGRDLTGWDGNPKIWSAEEGAIVGRTLAEAPLEKNTFLIRRDLKLRDFRLRFEFRIENGNSGVQYRSRVVDPKKWVVNGYQADIDSGARFTGILYEEGGRGVLAERGQRVTIDEDGKRHVAKFADGAELNKAVKPGEWNNYVVEVQGDSMRHLINGQLMSETQDAERNKSPDSGILALQIHKGPPMTVRFRNISVEQLEATPGNK